MTEAAGTTSKALTFQKFSLSSGKTKTPPLTPEQHERPASFTSPSQASKTSKQQQQATKRQASSALIHNKNTSSSTKEQHLHNQSLTMERHFSTALSSLPLQNSIPAASAEQPAASREQQLSTARRHSSSTRQRQAKPAITQHSNKHSHSTRPHSRETAKASRQPSSKSTKHLEDMNAQPSSN